MERRDGFNMINDDLLSLINKNSDDMFKKIITAMPIKYVPVVNQADAENKFLVRYFTRQINDFSSIVEIDKKQYDDFKENFRFITVSLQWKIIGKKDTIYLPSGVPLYGVEDTNKIAVADADLTFGGLRSYIVDYLEFWVSEV